MSKAYTQPMSDEPVPLIEGQAHHRLLTVMQALFWGLEVKLDNLTFRLAKNNNNNGVCPVFLMGDNQDLVMGASSNMVAQMPEDVFKELERSLINSQTLTEFNQRTRNCSLN